MKKLKLSKNFLLDNLYLFVLIFSTFLTYFIGELYFYTPNGIDFEKYVKYLDYFQYNSETTQEGQGLIYYFIVSLVSFIRKDEVSSLNEINYMNSNIHLANFIFYLIGIFGFYILLQKYGYKKRTIFLTLTIVNFCLPVFIMRSILKPEILAFCLLPWIVIGLEDYFGNTKIRNFLVVAFPLIIALTLKGSITAMLGIFLFLKYFRNIRKSIKTHFICFFILILLFSFVFIENERVNNYSVFEHNLTGYSNYNNVASADFLYTLHKWDYYYFPIFPYHNDSLIGITLLDTFGDYFNVFIDSDEHLFFYERADHSFFKYTDSDGFNFGRYFIEYSSILLTLLFYLFGLYFSIKDNRRVIFYLAPLIGIFILTLSAFGIPFNHFDPSKGDTMKSNYYSFLIGFSIIFIFAKVFQNINLLKVILVSFIPVIFFISLGFPKQNTEIIENFVEEKIIISPLCEVASIFIKNTNYHDCSNKLKKHCEYNIYSNDAQNMIYKQRQALKINQENKIKFIDNEKTIEVSDIKTCTTLIKNNTEIFNPIFNRLRPPPVFNLIYLLLTIYSIIYLARSNYNKK